MVADLWPGRIAWVDLGPQVGREQSGRRPAVIVSTLAHLAGADTLVTVVPCTTRSRSWLNHVELDGPVELHGRTYAMTEQVRTISRQRVHRLQGSVSMQCLEEISRWIHAWHVPVDGSGGKGPPRRSIV